MPQTIRQVYPGLNPLPSAYNPVVVRLVHAFLPLVMRFRTRPWLPAGITRVDVSNPERLASLYQQFQAGKVRFMLAFRHVEVDDPLSGLYMLSRMIPKAAREKGVKLRSPLHVHFLFDRGMPLWGGPWLGWLLSRMGGVSVHRGKHPDWQALRTSRELMLNGELPFAIAPEGATNGHSEILGPLEPGVAQMGFWCAEDLQKAGRPETVWIVPIGIQYHYIGAPWHNLDRLMTQLETNMGLPPQPLEPLADDQRPDAYYKRLIRLGEHFLTKMEQFYSRFYHRPLPPKDLPPDAPNITRRLQALLDEALKVSEEYFGVSSKGNLSERCRRLEEAAWTYIYRADVSDRNALSPIDRGLGDWLAEEASLHDTHMRLVESLVAVTGSYVKEKPSFERFAEITLLLFDATARIRGDKYPRRPRLGYRRCQMTVSEPICVSDRFPDYQTSRRAARDAINTLTTDLQHALEATIES
ncbi:MULTISPECIES: 1-acyl-sn-glycerol-3-phosphate acyltransferase [unclassified Leptolyngbya]|uniref:lysophospholipid acyltransferase family protein n=1 Tax=unclassified Leptolyngbya TaxID=2650499 RepID=UPI001688D350|nr:MULTISPECIES: 1-acyl-sn-glycerol-3-phosphate acyltransferase [unclassified Leptolyngbya]MBD1911678.1 1-acyl-sn-glycerol-3-phosphate acyltransferase [Leptolyngbya sp. FACHB-8]MBD2155513.1 1-acyl-sn-glycerol-3-phosphate acyltransferase [Leptolyngbya sp. FACHB-16]